MAAENAAIRMQLVENDIAQILKEPRPARVVREDARMQHVRIGQYHMAFFADGLARVSGRISIVGEYTKAMIEPLIQVIEFGELVLCKRLCGKKVERARVGVFQNRVQHGKVVAECFSGSCGRDNHGILSGMRYLRRRGLVRVEPTYAL